MTSMPNGSGSFSKLSDHWRSATTRLILIYGTFFVIWSALLIGLAYWETSRYLERVVDEILEQRVHYLGTIDREHLPQALEATDALDLRGVMSLGLFAKDGTRIAGNIERIPADLPLDGRIRGLPQGIQRGGREPHRARGLAMRLPGGEQLVIARDTSVIDGIGAILRHALFWGLTLTVIPGLIGGFLLSRRPLRRVREIETAMEPIARGDLGRRLPVSRRGDEVDTLAGMVNRMLGEIERLLGEVKSVGDSIAHDLRTPLTRLRAQLHRLQQKGDSCEDRAALVDRCVVDVDALLGRFRALLRISELEDLRRRAGFGEVDLGETLRQVHELYAPLAEDRGITFRIETPRCARVHADPNLLVEAISNLVANAIKFAPAGGRISVRTRMEERGACVDVCDNGPGIPVDERELVLQRFYRNERGRDSPEQGHGLGLTIASAIVRLHGFRLRIGDNLGGGACVGIECWDDTGQG
ncbi:ATP-binding protein [Dokdonella sp.]|uniref:sensor histidine kinase n=1 Tax=Dokdonella sp. TaxID=2291710 RepID=UPI00260A04BA|nr:ATP-binding protein [Dokdonella sp.]